MKIGRNPTRRNRNIGTASQGHGSNNKLVISESLHTFKRFWENLQDYQVVHRAIGEKQLSFIVENTRKDSLHSCTIDDITYLLQYLPAEDLQHIDIIVLRQPKRKEEIIINAWGRAVLYIEIGDYSGPAIILEAQSLSKPIRQSKSLDPDDQDEMERLRQDGHIITTNKHHHIIDSTIDSVRATQLYRTLIHEIGHHIDYPKYSSESWNSRPSMEKEAFAHKYADMQREKLQKEGIIPFDRILDLASLERDGLLVDDFTEQKHP